jgi:hypothetical protein
MLKAGWTPETFAASLNSTIRLELSRKPIPGKFRAAPEEITLQQAQTFLAKGEGIGGDTFDSLERWAERRRGMSNTGAVFDRPPETLTMPMVSPPVILPAETELSAEGPAIAFADHTNERARRKYLAGGTTSSAAA